MRATDKKDYRLRQVTPNARGDAFPCRDSPEYFTNIVVDATTNMDDEPSVRCRRRPRRRRCSGIIMSYPAADDLDRIHWYCPVCNDNGFISGWQNTIWDGFSANETTH